MEGAPVEYVNGMVEEQAAPQTLQELQAAVQDVHAMPVVVAGFQEVLAAEAQAAAGTPTEQTAGDDCTPGLHAGGGMPSRGVRMSSSSFKNRVGPLFCQVDGCSMPLDNLKEYHQRYKVCEEHLKTPFIIRDGQQVRFCQQCGRFQPLEDFDDNKRSCRVRLQRHNARRRKRPRDGMGGSADHLGDYGMAGSVAAAAEMAKLASYAPAAIPITTKEIQAMQEALHFASTTLMHSSQVVTGKLAGEEGSDEGGEGGGGGGAVAMGPGSMPFVPAPDVMMLLLKGYAAMFHYALDSATLRALAPPSDLPDQQATAAGSLGLGAIDALQMQHLMQAQGVFAGPGMPLLLPGGEGLAADGQEVGTEGQQEQLGGAAAEQQQETAIVEHQQHERVTAVAAAHATVDGGELTAEQVATALIQPMPQDAVTAEGAMAAAAALAAAAGAAIPASTAYLATGQVAAAAEQQEQEVDPAVNSSGATKAMQE